MTMNEVVNAFAVKNENDEVVSFDFASFDALVSELVTKRSEIRKSNKEAIKEQNLAEREEMADAGKKYYDSLKEADEFSYKNSKGDVIVAKKITPKAGGKSAACEVVSGIEIAEGKTRKRYPKFYQIVLPADAE